MLTRDCFRFSPGGWMAACVASDGQGDLHLEAWSFAGPSPRWWPLPLTTAVTAHLQPIPLDDGRVLLWREGSRDAPDAAYEIVLLDAGGDRPERLLGAIPGDVFALRLLPCPVRQPGETVHLGVAVSIDARGSTIWRLAAEPPHLQRLAEIPGMLLGGAWLDRAGEFLGLDHMEGKGPIKAVAVDLRDGSWTPLLTVSETSNDRLLACDPRSGLLVVSTDATGEERLGWGRLGGPEPVRFPEALHRPGHPVACPVTFDPEGQRIVLLHLDEGARVGLAVYTPATDHLAPVETPAGVIHGGASWVGESVRFLFSAPCQPPGVATIRMGRVPGWSMAGSAPAPSGTRWVDAHVESLDGAAGPIEAIVYGGEDWRTSRHLLMALHGGPMDAWRFAFEPLFQRLAAAGIAIVAPNQRGSSRYGAAYAQAIRGAWGGPDTDDVCRIARTLDTQRREEGAPALMLLGVSYGAFLALLASCREPDLWSRCVALAPFLSVSRLYQEASPGVRTLIDGLGGLPELPDETGPRDVLRLCAAIRTKLLIVHGERDELIPVSQPRALRQRLLALGRREGLDFEYLEIPGSGHDLIVRDYTQMLHERLMHFLIGGARSSQDLSLYERERRWISQ
ncbi:MAG: alpha/beta hydrolase family protein [Egibacteraceae bacterium]